MLLVWGKIAAHLSARWNDLLNAWGKFKDNNRPFKDATTFMKTNQVCADKLRIKMRHHRPFPTTSRLKMKHQLWLQPIEFWLVHTYPNPTASSARPFGKKTVTFPGTEMLTAIYKAVIRLRLRLNIICMDRLDRLNMIHHCQLPFKLRLLYTWKRTRNKFLKISCTNSPVCCCHYQKGFHLL